MDEEEDVDTSFGGVLPSEMRIAGPSLSDPSPVDGVFGSGGLGGVDIAEMESVPAHKLPLSSAKVSRQCP